MESSTTTERKGNLRKGVRFVEPAQKQADDPERIAQSQERQRKMFQFFLDMQDEEASYHKPWRDEIATKLEAVGGWNIDFFEGNFTSNSVESSPVITSCITGVTANNDEFEPRLLSPSLTQQIRLPRGRTPVQVLDGVLPDEWCKKLIAAHIAVGFTPQHVLDATVGSPIKLKTQELLSQLRSKKEAHNLTKPNGDDGHDESTPNHTKSPPRTAPDVEQEVEQEDISPQSQQQSQQLQQQHHDQQQQQQQQQQQLDHHQQDLTRQTPLDAQMDTYRTADGKGKNTAEVIEIVSQEFADAIWRRVCAFVPKTIQLGDGAVITGNTSVVGLIPVFRFMRYSPGQAFKPHHDPSRLANKHPVTGKSGRFKSLVTLALYLNNADEFEGGGLHFVELVRNPQPAGKPLIGKPFATVTPKQGRCGIFEHSHLHESEVVVKGVKHMVQCDVLYELSF